MTIHHCATGCGRPTQDMLCSTCLTHLVTDLRQLATGGVARVRRHQRVDGSEYEVTESRPGLIEELQITITRQDVLGSPLLGGRSPEQALLFHEAASEVSWILRNTISTWARDVAETYAHLTLSATTTTEAAGWLANLPTLLAEHPAAGELHDEITSVVREVRRVIDRSAERIYLGKCGSTIDEQVCDDDLYGIVDRDTAHCRTCGTEYDAHTRWLDIQDRVRGSLATAAEIAGAAARMYGRMLKIKTIRTWAFRGVIETHGRNERDEPLHLVGQVLDQAARSVRSVGLKCRSRSA
jgi:hypothetical protein